MNFTQARALNSRLETGFLIAVKNALNEVKAIIQSQFQQTTTLFLPQTHFQVFHINLANNLLSQVFDFCTEKLKKPGLITDFSIVNSSLKQMYSIYCELQIHEEEQEFPFLF